MKTQEIQLEAGDDLVSICDRMAWAHTPRVLLIWPLEGGIKINPSELFQLGRQAERLGQELGIVTRDRDFYAAARKLNLSVFSHVAEAEETPWADLRDWHFKRRFARPDLRGMRNNLPSPDLYPVVTRPGLRMSILAVGVLAVLSMTLFFLPSAEIQITSPEKYQDVTIAVSSDPQASDIQISGVVPQHVLTVTLSGQQTALVTGKMIVPAQKASGVITLTNLTGKAVTLPAGSLVTTTDTPPILFETTQEAQVPAGKGKTAVVQVEAQQPGPDGNVSAGEVRVMQGNLSSVLAVTNPGPFGGGTQVESPLASDQDREALRKRLLADLQQQALGRLGGLASANDVLFQDTLSLAQVSDEIYTPPEGQVGEKLSLNLTAQFNMAYASGVELREMARRVLDASLPQGYTPVVKQITIETQTGFVRVKNVVYWQLQVKRQIQAFVNPGAVIPLVQGKMVDAAQAALSQSLGLTVAPTIRIQPGWWPWLPNLPIRISVTG